MRIPAWTSVDFALLLTTRDMAEVSARISKDSTDAVQDPGDGALPLSGGLRFGIRRGRLTVRSFLGAGAGSHSAHAVPLRTQAAVLAEFGPQGRLGSNVVLRGAHLHVPFDIGIAVPWTPQSRYSDGSLGVLVRLILEIDHD